MVTIKAIPAFTDNYIWAVCSGTQCIIVDPGDSAPVFDFLQHHKLELAAIIITHWHPDHIGGVDALLHQHDIPVYGPDSPHIPQVNHVVSDHDVIQCLGLEFVIMTVPGHTLDHIAYHSRQAKALFCGDTLFAGGCGRLFEGTPEMMLESLEHLKQLPGDTNVYCAHEYTVANLQFAIEVEPDNPDLQQRLKDCISLRKSNMITLPSTLEKECRTNPFLRVSEPTVILQALNQGAKSDSAVDVFSCIREWKNNF